MSDQPRLANDQWLTLAKAAETTGLSVDALRQRAKRGKLETMRGNDGLVLIRLTTADREALRLAADRSSAPTLTSHSDLRDQTIKALEEQATSLREAVGRERERADAAESRVELAERERGEARERAARAEGELTGVKLTLSELRDALAEARKPFWRRWVGL